MSPRKWRGEPRGAIESRRTDPDAKDPIHISTAEWQEIRRPLLELIHRQRLISAGFGTVEPSLQQLIESYIVVLLESHTLNQVSEILNVNKQTLRHWMRAWDGTEDARRDLRLTRWKA